MPRCSNDDRYYQIADWRQTKPSPIHQICHNTYYTLFPLFPLTLLYMHTCPLSFVSNVRESSGTLGNLDVSLTQSGKISAVIYPHLVGGNCMCSIAAKDSRAAFERRHRYILEVFWLNLETTGYNQTPCTLVSNPMVCNSSI